MSKPKREITIDCLMTDLENEYCRGKETGYCRGFCLGISLGAGIGFVAACAILVFLI